MDKLFKKISLFVQRSPEVVEYSACWRGTTIGVQAAEAFILGRNLIK
jgi:hypothetical protein